MFDYEMYKTRGAELLRGADHGGWPARPAGPGAAPRRRRRQRAGGAGEFAPGPVRPGRLTRPYAMSPTPPAHRHGRGRRIRRPYSRTCRRAAAAPRPVTDRSPRCRTPVRCSAPWRPGQSAPCSSAAPTSWPY